MKKPNPLNEERVFLPHELFFSTTDSHGKIIFGNETFMRISGYPKSNMIGAPHCIIRHPDMPKTVFKLFWDELKAGRAIGAYVKNLAADGKYYWVFAFAYPVEDGYLSIRVKPTSPIIDKVIGIYDKVLKKENPSKLSEEYLLELIREEGFASYQDFMVTAAIAELGQRESYLAEKSATLASVTQLNSPITQLTKITSRELNTSFNKITNFQQVGKFLSDSINSLNGEFKKLTFVSVNMNILAAKYGLRAASLEVVSREFSKLSSEISTHFNSFASFVEETSKAILECSQSIVSLKSQMIMVEFFVNESLQKSQDGEHAFDEMIQNQGYFCKLFEQSIRQLNREILKLHHSSLILSTRLAEIHTFTVGLEVVKLVGAVESSRENETKQDFDVYLLEMTSFINHLKESVKSIHNQNELLKADVKEIEASNKRIFGNISSLFRMALDNDIAA